VVFRLGCHVVVVVSHRVMVSGCRSKSLTGRYIRTMALDQSVLLELLGELKLTEVTDRIRTATETFYQALFAVVMEAYVHGVWTRKLDDLVKALGADTGISTSEASRICANLDEDLAAFRDRPLADATYPYVFLDATYCKARIGRPVVSQAVVVGVAADRKKRSPRLRGRRDRIAAVLDHLPAVVEGSRTGRGEAHHLATLTAG